jgi:DNA-binding Lrp family transcriptional regulator
MARQIAASIDGFTPLFDVLANQKGGLIKAAVFGRVWRYCQHDSGVCYASHETIAADLGITRPTAHHHIRELVRDGYLEDLTPARKNHSHTYRATNKVSLEASVTVKEFNTGVKEFTPTVKDVYSKRQQETSKETKAASLGVASISIMGTDIANSASLESEATQPKVTVARLDGATDFFNRAVKAKTAAALIQKWNLPVHLQDICLEFAGVFNVEADGPTPTITARSKKKWAASAAQLYEIRPTHAELVKARDIAAGKFPISHPGAAVNTIINLRAMNPKPAPLTHSAPVVFRDMAVNDDE